MREEFEKDYDDFTLRDIQDGEISGSLSPFTFLCVSFLLVLLGLVMAYSASYDSSIRLGYDHYHFLLEMVIFGILGLISGTILFFTPRAKLERLFYFILPLSFILLIVNAVENAGLDTIGLLSGFPELNGSDAFIFSAVLALSFILPRMKENGNGSFFYPILLIVSLLLFLLISLSGSLTYSIFFFFSMCVALVSARMEKKFIFFYALFHVTLLIFVILASQSSLDLIFSRLMPNYVSSGESENALLCLSAISEGGLFGKGIGSSYFKLGHISKIEDEYVFACIAEEIGFLGTLLIFFFFFLFFFLGLRCSRRARRKGDEYLGILSISLSFLVVFKALLSALVTASVIPLSGISMPFFSSNGFSYFITIVECALLYRAMHSTGRSR